jgi:hypothetical protein
MKKLSVFIMAAALAGLFELAAAQGDQHSSSNKTANVNAAGVLVKNDTLPSKKKNKKTTDPMQNPTPAPAPSPNPPNPSPNPTPTPTQAPSPNPPTTTPAPTKMPPNY